MLIQDWTGVLARDQPQMLALDHLKTTPLEVTMDTTSTSARSGQMTVLQPC